MKRNFREPKNRYKNGAITARRKISAIKNTQTLENKRKFQGERRAKKPDIAKDTAQIRLSGKSKDD